VLKEVTADLGRRRWHRQYGCRHQPESNYLVSEFSWGNADIRGVCSDGNELVASDGAMGCFSAVEHRQLGGLDRVSFLAAGAQVWWVQELSNLDWIAGRVPLEVFRQGNYWRSLCRFYCQSKDYPGRWEIYSLWLRYLTAGAGWGEHIVRQLPYSPNVQHLGCDHARFR